MTVFDQFNKKLIFLYKKRYYASLLVLIITAGMVFYTRAIINGQISANFLMIITNCVYFILMFIILMGIKGYTIKVTEENDIIIIKE